MGSWSPVDSNKQIAADLDVSEMTVKIHRGQ